MPASVDLKRTLIERAHPAISLRRQCELLGLNRSTVYYQPALDLGTPEIFNTDQGVQFTTLNFTGCLASARIRISMDGRGRAFANLFIERLWRSVNYEDIYLNDYAAVPELETGLAHYFHFYNHDRPHQSLQYRTPAEVQFA